MTKELAEKLVEVCALEEEEVTLYESYSGRGQFGKLTTGIEGKTISLSKLLGYVIAHAEIFVEEGESMFVSEELSQDNLGKGYIIY